MSLSVGILNIVLGFVYTQYGVMTMIEMWRNRDTMGFSHFGLAWIAMAFTCGPHHFVHGLHVVAEGRSGGVLDLVAVLVGFPAGVIWFALRVEAFVGGRGDRFIPGSPLWVLALPTLAGIYLTALVAALLGLGPWQLSHLPLALPNILLVPIYITIGYFLIRTQVANRRPLGGWSLSGLSLAVIFPTCAAMHAVYAAYLMTTVYVPDWHGLSVGWLAVPAGLYFLWVVRALYKGTFRDWNGAPRATSSPVPAPAELAVRG